MGGRYIKEDACATHGWGVGPAVRAAPWISSLFLVNQGADGLPVGLAHRAEVPEPEAGQFQVFHRLKVGLSALGVAGVLVATIMLLPPESNDAPVEFRRAEGAASPKKRGWRRASPKFNP